MVSYYSIDRKYSVRVAFFKHFSILPFLQFNTNQKWAFTNRIGLRPKKKPITLSSVKAGTHRKCTKTTSYLSKPPISFCSLHFSWGKSLCRFGPFFLHTLHTVKTLKNKALKPHRQEELEEEEAIFRKAFQSWVEEVEAGTIVTSRSSLPKAVSFKSVRVISIRFLFRARISMPWFRENALFLRSFLGFLSPILRCIWICHGDWPFCLVLLFGELWDEKNWFVSHFGNKEDRGLRFWFLI